MHVTIFTTGRFHLLDLARELHLQGIRVTFRSAVPVSRAETFGLPATCCSPMPWLMPLQWTMMRSKSTRFKLLNMGVTRRMLDRFGTVGLTRSDIFIGISGVSGFTGLGMKKKYGAKIWIERGSRHILSQKHILDTISDGRVSEVSAEDVRRELADYGIADRVVIPARHVEQSFIAESFSVDRLFRNPYGVDLKMFPATPPPSLDSPATLVMAGKWGKRKGCDILVQAWRGMENTRLVHVGQQGDLPFPEDGNFEHVAHVNQSELTKVYRRAHVGVLASREEGLAIVQAQMLATGLHLVCSDRTGGRDLGENAGIMDRIAEVQSGDIDSLRRELTLTLKKSKGEDAATRMSVRNKMERNSWIAYGARYAAELAKSFNGEH